MIDESLGQTFAWPQYLSVMMDFEPAERNAWLFVHPSHSLQGCMFHFVGSLWKYVHKNGKSSDYSAKTENGRLFKGLVWMTFSLPLVPLHRIVEAIDLIKLELEDFISPGFQRWCENYVQHIENTWIQGQYPPQHWNFYDRLSEGHLTNNACEGLNHRLRVKMKTDHPGIYKFFGVISKETSYSLSKIEQVESGNLTRFQTRRTKAIEKTRLNLKTLLENGQITLKKYMRAQGAMQKVRLPQRTRNQARVTEAEDVENAVNAVVNVSSVGLSPARGRRVGRFRGGAMRSRGGRGRGVAPAQRQCPDCGGVYNRQYLRTHQRRYCHGRPQADANDDESNNNSTESDSDDLNISNSSETEDVNPDGTVEEIFEEISEVERTIQEQSRNARKRSISEIYSDEEDFESSSSTRIREVSPRPSFEISVVAGPSTGVRAATPPPPHVNFYDSNDHLVDRFGNIVRDEETTWEIIENTTADNLDSTVETLTARDIEKMTAGQETFGVHTVTEARESNLKNVCHICKDPLRRNNRKKKCTRCHKLIHMKCINNVSSCKQ